MNTTLQLAALAGLHALFHDHGLSYWLFGGWAVDFHAGAVTRPHADIDIAVWADDLSRIAAMLERDGWRHTPDDGEDGYTRYQRDGIRLDLAYLARSSEGSVYTPLRDGRADWPPDAFQDDTATLLGVTARLISLDALRRDKAESRADAAIAAKDLADCMTLSRIS